MFERVYSNLVEETGAVIMGRRSYGNSIEAWGGKGPFLAAVLVDEMRIHLINVLLGGDDACSIGFRSGSSLSNRANRDRRSDAYRVVR